MGFRGGDLEVELKDGDEPVTIADKKASEHIVGGIEAAFPNDVVISEENPDDRRRLERDRVWFVDPIDGTADFIDGHDGFCVMIGLATAGRPILGAIYHPPSKELIVAAEAAGAWLLPTGADPINLSVSSSAILEDSRVVAASGNRSLLKDDEKTVLTISAADNIGSIGLRLAVVAAGDRDLFCNPASRSSVWDTCAPEVILREAGGVLSDVRGEPLSYVGDTTRHKRGLVGCNQTLHAPALARLAPLLG